ncbi:PhoH family protein [Halobacillus litoralis]|uniref:PhoH family protein n=1 Tax=Halobacillus litoralis TaxID=45668 RepID=UPI001CD1DB68|nr:PhoH family protein [Halobacillus litoralis]MCA1021628.1 PhoH family protein [Halobacillus litoralis]
MGNKYGDIRFKWLADKGFNVLADKHQYAYMQSLWSPLDLVQAVFCSSRAGTGKTTLAVLAGVYEVEKGNYDKIIYVRNAVSIRDQGFLPGGLNEKEVPYMTPLIEAMDNAQPSLYYEWSGEKEVQNGGEEPKHKRVVATTSSFTRGITFKNAFVILDEAQNMDLDELQAIYTRCSDTCKIVSIGCTRQVDNGKMKRYGGLTPFELYIEHFKGQKVTNHKLETNYRGWFSNMADDIDDTVQRLKYDKQ